MKNLTDAFLSEDDRQKIRNTVKQIEKETSGEIVPMVVASSYHYPVSDILGSFILAMIISLAVILSTGDYNVWFFLAIFMPLLIILHAIIKRTPLLKRLFISQDEINEEVKEAAITSFFTENLHKTKDETGVLIFISVFEKKVWVLADRGINEKVNKDAWKDIVNIIVQGIKEKKQTDAIIKAITMAGDLLKSNFPVKHDDTDELSNLIIKK